MSLSKEQWEAKFGGGRKIRLNHWNDDYWVIFQSWDGSDAYFNSVDKDNDYDYLGWKDDSWELYEEPTPTIQEKTIEDFPLVEVSNDNTRWIRMYYLFSNDKHRCSDDSGYSFSFKYMRPIQKVDVEDLKRKAFLV